MTLRASDVLIAVLAITIAMIVPLMVERMDKPVINFYKGIG